MKRLTLFISSIPARLIVGLIWGYRCFISPVKNALLGPGGCCRFYPTCSDYAVQSVQAHGAVKGLLYSVIRLLKCHPFHRGGFDPVKPAASRKGQTLNPALACTIARNDPDIGPSRRGGLDRMKPAASRKGQTLNPALACTSRRLERLWLGTAIARIRRRPGAMARHDDPDIHVVRQPESLMDLRG